MSVSDSVIVNRLRAAGCVFAEDEARLLLSTARTSDELDAMVDRRAAGLPLEQVLGENATRGPEPANDERVGDSHIESAFRREMGLTS